MSSVWRVEMLGAFQARTHGQTVSRFRTRKVGALLAYLALYSKRVHTRDEIAALLWPDADEAESRRNFRQALYSLRKVLEPPSLPTGSVLEVKQAWVSLNANAVSTDVEEMSELADRAKDAGSAEDRLELLKQAVGLYKGELLPGYHELWVMNERFRMEDVLLSSLRAATEVCDELGRPDEAIQFIRLALEKEPLDEAWHKSLMRHYLAFDRPESALKHYDRLAQLLKEELDAVPDAELQSLVEQARKGARPRRVGKEASGQVEIRVAESKEERVGALSRIPLSMTRFFGRQSELEAIESFFGVDQGRLLTILGPAGIGKTRLSVEVLRRLAEEGWEAWFAPLADISDSGQILDYVLETVRPERGLADTMAQLVRVLDKERGILVLDNFEHLAGDGGSVVRSLLEAAPKLRVLVTSQRALNIEGEMQFVIGPLPVPQLPEGGVANREQLAELAEYPSIQLLVDRFQFVRPDVQITMQNAKHFAGICEWLEGIPLALEIAAGLSKSSAPSQIVKQLDNRLAALTSRRKDVVPRYQSLRAAIEYSYQSLSPELKSLFASLAVFQGGFSPESAFEVCFRADGELSSREKKEGEHACLNAILDLQDRSLVQPDLSYGDDAPLRFRMLETFREFGEEKLSDGELASLRDRHAEYFLSTGLKDGEEHSAEARAKLHSLIKVDGTNYLLAADFLFKSRRIVEVIRLLTICSFAWDVRGTTAAEQKLIRAVTDLPETAQAPYQDRVHLLGMLGTTYLRNSEFGAAFNACERAYDVAKESGDEWLIMRSLFGMSLCAGYLGQTELCIELSEKVLELASDSAAVLRERTFVNIGCAHWVQDEFEEAESAFLKAKEVSERFRGGDPDALILAHMAGLAVDRGQLDEAMVLASDGIRTSRSREDEIGYSACLVQVARYHLYRENFLAAKATCREALVKAKKVGISMQCLETIRAYAVILGQAGDSAEAVVLVAASRGLESMQKAADRREEEAVRELALKNLGTEDFENAWARGLAMNLDEAFAFALGLSHSGV